MKLISSTDGYSGAKMQLDFTAFPYAPFRINLLARSLFACGLLIAASVLPAAQPADPTVPPWWTHGEIPRSWGPCSLDERR